MGCQKTKKKPATTTSNCVQGTIQQIINAQRKVEKQGLATCSTSCERSIADLLSPGTTVTSPFTTIPFMLICKNSCKYFIGQGITQTATNDSTVFECLMTPVFKAKSFIKGSNNCVRLELLLPVSNGNNNDGNSDNGNENGESGFQVAQIENNGGCIPCDFFSDEVTGFQKTGVCITVDVNSFSGITCLDPITPEAM